MALPDKEAFQQVRALPAAAGEAVLFSHRIIHWGSAGSRDAPHPRVSISFGFADDAFEVPPPRPHIHARVMSWRRGPHVGTPAQSPRLWGHNL